MTPSRRRSPRFVHLLIAALAALPAVAPVAARGDEPDVVVVQHILIGFDGSVHGKEIGRSKRQAKELAESLLQRAQDGEDFDALVKKYTDDRYPGVYKISNTDAPLLPDAIERKGLVPGFGHVSFRLQIGEIGLVKYHAGNSPFGWHIIKRIE